MACADHNCATSMAGVRTHSTLTCPNCGHAKTEAMPTDACLFFYECERCETLLRPKQGDCCVFCSYGDVPCPPMQCAGHGDAQHIDEEARS